MIPIAWARWPASRPSRLLLPAQQPCNDNPSKHTEPNPNERGAHEKRDERTDAEDHQNEDKNIAQRMCRSKSPKPTLVYVFL